MRYHNHGYIVQTPVTDFRCLVHLSDAGTHWSPANKGAGRRFHLNHMRKHIIQNRFYIDVRFYFDKRPNQWLVRVQRL